MLRALASRKFLVVLVAAIFTLLDATITPALNIGSFQAIAIAYITAEGVADAIARRKG